jgi:hypothetical protein
LSTNEVWTTPEIKGEVLAQLMGTNLKESAKQMELDIWVLIFIDRCVFYLCPKSFERFLADIEKTPVKVSCPKVEGFYLKKVG